MRIQDKVLYTSVSLGFGILTMERLLNVVNLASEVFRCQDHFRCQTPILETLKASATVIACGYTSFKLWQNTREKHVPELRRYTPRLLRPKPMQEIVAFHPGEQPEQKRYIYDTLDKLDD